MAVAVPFVTPGLRIERRFKASKGHQCGSGLETGFIIVVQRLLLLDCVFDFDGRFHVRIAPWSDRNKVDHPKPDNQKQMNANG
jgi:hypothetical protein